MTAFWGVLGRLGGGGGEASYGPSSGSFLGPWFCQFFCTVKDEGLGLGRRIWAGGGQTSSKRHDV